VIITHETHRGRCLFHPTISRELLEEFPALKLTFDISHWVCVCERLIDDQMETIRLAADRTLHVHCRLGHQEGPQTPDPRSDQWVEERGAFYGWWTLIAESMQARGIETYSFCPEFGPPPYQARDAQTGEVIGDLKAICDWQKDEVERLVGGVRR